MNSDSDIDVTDKKLRQLYEEVHRIAKVGGWELDLENETLIWSRMVKEIHEVPPDYVPDLEAGIDFYKKGEHRETITRAVRKAIDHGTPFDLELLIVTANGNERWVRVTGRCDMRDGTSIRVYGAIQDIHQNQLNREKIQLSERRFRALVQDGADLISVLDEKGDFIYASPSSNNILGIPPDTFIGKNAIDFVHPDEREKIEHVVKNFPKQKRFETEHYRIQDNDGNWRWLETTITDMRDDPAVGGFVINSRDITNSRHLSELEKLERHILELYEKGETTLSELIRDYLKGIESLHPSMICMVMRAEKDRLFHWSSIQLPPSFLSSINQGIKIAANQGPTGTAAFRKEKVYAPDISQSPLWSENRDIPLGAGLKSCWCHPILSSNNELIATLTLFYRETCEPDDLEQKTVERTVNLFQIILDNRLKEQAYVEALNERVNVLERVSDAFFAVNREWTVTYWNNTAEEILEMPRVKIVGKNLWDEYRDAIPLKFYSEYHRAMERQVTVHFEEFYPPIKKWFEVSAYPSESGLSVYFKDITERKFTEKQLVDSLREKETLLAEIHHRVKNNLAVVSAMIQLQAVREPEGELRQSLFSSVGRIKTMANIHEHLYRSDSFSNLDFSESIQHLISEILTTVQGSQSIKWDYSSESIRINMNQAVPCSLITNEVITNAIKHAFHRDQKEKRLFFELSEEHTATEKQISFVRLTIKDNGKGLPADFEQSREESLGLRLIDLLTQQLKGEFSYKSDNNGTVFKLRFPKTDLKERGSSGNLTL